MARMISHTQLSSNRLQKQLFIMFLLSDDQGAGRHKRPVAPSVIILCRKTEAVQEFCREREDIIVRPDVLHRLHRLHRRRCLIGSRDGSQMSR